MKKTLLLFIMSFVSLSVFSQQDAIYTHYMENTLSVNPAYAGSRDALTATLLNRMQWVGFDGAPVTQTLTLHSPVFGDKVGLGLSVVNDKIGVLSNSGFMADFAYRIKFEKNILAFGFSAGLKYFNLNYGDGYIADDNDAVLLSNKRALKPDFGAGMYYYAEKYYIGLSATDLMGIHLSDSATGTAILTETVHYYLIGGGLLPMGKSWQFFPTALVKYTSEVNPEFDITASFVYNNKLRFGGMYRSAGDFGVLVGLYLAENIALSYSFDWSANNTTGVYNGGSHEIMLRYDLLRHKNKKVFSPRLF